MEKFIAVSQEAKEKLDHRLSQTPFKTVDEFIGFYNSGLVSKRADLVREIVSELTETYKDIEEKSGQLVFLDANEIYLSETLRELEPWVLITKIKREIQDAMDSGELGEGDPILFTPKATGILCKIVQDDEGRRTFAKIGVEKLFYKPDAIQEIFERYSTTGEGGDGTYYFYTHDFTNLNDSFIHEIYRLIPS